MSGGSKWIPAVWIGSAPDSNYGPVNRNPLPLLPENLVLHVFPLKPYWTVRPQPAAASQQTMLTHSPPVRVPDSRQSSPQPDEPAARTRMVATIVATLKAFGSEDIRSSRHSGAAVSCDSLVTVCGWEVKPTSSYVFRSRRKRPKWEANMSDVE